MRNLNLVSDDLPEIIIGNLDFNNLTTLVRHSAGRWVDAAEFLRVELDRAIIVDQSVVAKEVVCMGSTVTFKAVDGFHRTVELVYPAAADIDQSRISVLSPVGGALIGLCMGQSMPWTARDGRVRSLLVCGVSQNQ